MQVKIRLARHGAKKRPFYRIVVASSESPRDGRFLEELGHYDPLKGDENVALDRERVEYWLTNGAKMSATVKSIVKKLEI